MEMTGNMVPRENGIQPPARIAPQPQQQQQGPEQMLQILMMLLMAMQGGQGQVPMQGQPQGMPPQMPAAPPPGMSALLGAR